MMNKTISSLTHVFVKYLVNLRKDRKFRREEKKALVTGENLIFELLEKKGTVETLIVKEGFSHPPYSDTIYVSESIMKKITGLETPGPLASVVNMPPPADLSRVSFLLVLDGVSDPGNLGTLLRTAAALGWGGVYLTENTCDPFNEKAIRAAKGSCFTLPIEEGSWKDFTARAKGFTTFVADMEGVSFKTVSPDEKVALVLSRESKGARKEAKDLFTSIKIPMIQGAESLNVSAAGAILLSSLRGDL